VADDQDLADLAADVRRVADRLRTLSMGQLSASVPPYESRAAAGRAAAMALADAAQGFEHAGDPREPSWRALPELSAFAAGDMVAVTGHDLLAAAPAVPAAQEVWTRAGRQPAPDVLRAVAQLLTGLRRLL